MNLNAFVVKTEHMWICFLVIHKGRQIKVKIWLREHLLVSPELGWDGTFQEFAVKVLHESVFYVVTVNLLQEIAFELELLVRVVNLVCGGY